MTDLRVLTDAELDFVGGGITRPKPSQGCGENLVQEIIADILKILDGNNCNSGPVKANVA